MPSLNRFADLFRSQQRVDPTQLQAYADIIVPALQRLADIWTRWRQDLVLEAREDDLANAASIQRWEAAGLLERLQALEPPAALERCHAELLEVVHDLVRATQQLSNGYRFHSSRARCDGHALMLATEERFTALRRAFAQRGFSAGGGADGDAAPRP